MVEIARDTLRLVPETSARLFGLSIILSWSDEYEAITDYTSAARARAERLTIDRTSLVNVIWTELGTTA